MNLFHKLDLKHRFLRMFAYVRELEKCNEENARNFERLAKKELTLYELHVERGTINANFGTEAVCVMAAQFHELMKEKGATNYLECHFSPGHKEGQPEIPDFIVTLQYANGKTPGQMKDEAEAECRRLKSELAAVDDVLGNRLALDSEPDRVAKILKALRYAKAADEHGVAPK